MDQIAEDIIIDQQIAELDSYTGSTWNVQPASQIMAELGAKRLKNNVHVHRGAYGGNDVPREEE